MVQVTTGPSVGLFHCYITFGKAQEEKNKSVNLKTPLESSTFVSKVSRFTSTETNSAEPSYGSRWIMLLEEEWQVQGYRLLSITLVAITARITFSDSICSKQRKNGSYTPLNTAHTYLAMNLRKIVLEGTANKGVERRSTLSRKKERQGKKNTN